MQHFESKYNVLASSPPQQSHMQLGQSQQQHAMSQRQQMQYTQQQQQHDGQQQAVLQQQGPTPFYGNMNQQDMMFTGQEHQTSPVAFQWPPGSSMQQQQQHNDNNNNSSNNSGMAGDNSGNLTFSPAAYYDSSQTDAEIDAILSNYQPKLYANMQSFGGDIMSNQMNAMGSSQQIRSISQQHSNQGGNTSSNAMTQNRDQMNPVTAAAAVAAYGNLNYGSGSSSSSGSNNIFLNQQSNISQWDNMQNSAYSSDPNASGLDYQKSYNGDSGSSNVNNSSMSGMNGGRAGAYDADASNTSSTQTPGGVSSGDDSTGGKRRRMTVGGGLEAAEQQNRFEAGLSTGGQDGKGASAAQSNVGGSRPMMQHHGTSTIDSRTLERMAQESLQRAGEDNARGMNKVNQASRTTPSRPINRHRRSNSSSHVAGTSTLQNAVETSPPNMHKKNSQSVSHGIYTGPYQPSGALSGGVGFAASHPPGLGSHVLRGVTDSANSGFNAATDFTRRKGWPTRIVEELLDFVHVLDRQGRVLFASPSVLTLTGWRADELKGKELTDFVHPDDRASVRLEFQRSLAEKSEMTMYYRFQRKPQTAADKQKVHDQREAQQVSRSRSGSTSGNDSSSAPDSSNNNTSHHLKKSTFANGASDNHLVGGGLSTLEEEGEFQDDQREKYVIFEATGHPYYSSEETFPESDLNEELVEELLPKAIASSRSQKSKKLTSPPSSIKKESPSRPIDSGKETKAGVLDKGGGITNDIQCFFCSCRIYPTKNVGMLDSFLELKLENERLRMLLSELSVSDGPAPPNGFTNFDAGSDGRRSLDEGPAGYHLDYLNDMTDQQQQHHLHNNMVGGSIPTNNAGRSSMGSSNATDGGKDGNRRGSTRSGSGGQMSLPTSPNISHALERTLTGGTNVAGAGGEDSDDNGESGAMTADEKRKKKKSKPEEGDYVCTDCGRVDSPEWRKGPLGPKTLCNACGLRWAKKVKRNGGDPNAIAMAAKPAKGQIKAQAAAARAQKQGSQFQQQRSQQQSQQADTSDSYHSIIPTSLASQANQNHTPMNHNSVSGYSSNQSPPNNYETHSFSIYGDTSSLSQPLSNQEFLQSNGIPYDQSTLQHASNLSNYTNHMQ